VAVAAERVTTAEVAHTAEVVGAISAVVVPGGRAIANGGVSAADEGKAPDDFLRLLAALGARNELKDIAHRHALLGVRAASGTDVFIQSHARIVEVPRTPVNLQGSRPAGPLHFSKTARSKCMEEQAEAAKKTALLMIPYGLYVLGTKNGGEVSAGTVNWVTQCSFKPPLVAMGVKQDSGLYSVLKSSGSFALSFLESGQKDIAYAFFKPTNVDGQTINGQAFETASTGSPIISAAAAWVEGRIVGEVALGDHSCVVGEVTNAGVKRESRLLTLEEVGVKYGG
jgi:flavin reductase (DIM6/NTAB) family NADH-FMN oxidoreductase RutF